MLEGLLYRRLSLGGELSAAKASVVLLDDSPIYKAHFPGFPVTPGVCIVGMAVELASLFFPWKEVRIVGFLLVLYDLIIYAGTQGNYLANLLLGIDEHTASGSLISMILFLGIALLASLLSFILLKEKKSSFSRSQ